MNANGKVGAPRERGILRALGVLAAGFAAFWGGAAARADGTAVVLELEGALGVATAEYIIGGIEDAEERGANIVIIRMDTPGGLVEPMRDIVSAILASSVPVATYVSPGGARADSAGTYILFASHVAAMAPTTHVGAATPVSLGGGEPPDSSPPFGEQPPQDKDNKDRGNGDAGDSESANDGETADEPADEPETDTPVPGSAMERKVLNDAIAYIRGLAEAHGRNAEWAEKAVRDAATLTAEEALELNVIDLMANDQSELLAAIHGREVKVNNQALTLATEGLEIEIVEPSLRIKILTAISNPEIALLLVLIGIYGLMFEGYNPGAIVPGVVGVIALLLAAYALQVIPVNYAGLALILVGIAMIVAEAFVPSFGALGLGGIAAFVFGAIMMFDSGIPGYDISIAFVVVFAAATATLLFLMVTYQLKLRRRGPVSGRGSIVGGTGVAMEDFSGKGKIWLEGESWQAVSSTPIVKDQQVVVREMDGLILRVEPLVEHRNEAELQT
ncbi:MAG TPA: nodulation protein NfeD [Woeseiaceae bacterium]|nr:nodulation protein NfeD [Woeseiaceae bacterium]